MAKLILPDNRTPDLLPTDKGQTLMALLLRCGLVFDAPCGGNGRCGKCALQVLSGALTPPDEEEAKLLGRFGAGYRLSCRARVADIHEDIRIGALPESLLKWPASVSVPLEGAPGSPEEAVSGTLALAIDLGTTTLELSLTDTARPGASLARTRVPNPQRAYGGDVMSRLSAARSGKADALRSLIQSELERQTTLLLKQAGYTEPSAFPKTSALCGNPAMLCLALGLDTKGLRRAPFSVPDTFGKAYPFSILMPGREGTLLIPPLTGPFTGADLTSAVIASGFDRLTGPALFCDLGTNAELCLFDGKSYTCCSAAAGPAFEGAGIRMGGSYGPGAITRVGLSGNRLEVETVNNTPADHLSANGLFDAVSALLKPGKIAPSGAIADDRERENGIRIGDTPVFLYKEDIRALQTAKAAVRAALELLVARSGVKGPIPLYVTGGIAVSDAFRTLGIIPPVCEPIRAANALRGLELLLAEPEPVLARMNAFAGRCTVLPLAGDPAFEEAFIASLPFPDPE